MYNKNYTPTKAKRLIRTERVFTKIFSLTSSHLSFAKMRHVQLSSCTGTGKHSRKERQQDLAMHSFIPGKGAKSFVGIFLSFCWFGVLSWVLGLDGQRQNLILV